MGGLGSGRIRTHTNIVDCLAIDAIWLKKQKLLSFTQPVDFVVKWKKTTHTNFVQTKEHKHTIGATFTPGEHPTLAVYYNLDVTHLKTGEKKTVPHYHTLQLVSTPCHYGGRRWWFACPECSRRVRVLYINHKIKPAQMKPECRHCQELHHESQIASYIERHKTYERYLLSNYGMYWAEERYECELKEHYLQMTPELYALKERSENYWNTHLVLRIIRCDLAIYRSNLAVLKSIKSEADRSQYWQHMSEQERESNTLRLVKILRQCLECERLIHHTNTGEMSDALFDIYEHLVNERTAARQALAEQVAHTEAKITSLEEILRQTQKKKAA